MIKELSNVELELGTAEVIIRKNITDINVDLIKYLVNFGANLVIDLRKNEFDVMMDEMYHSFLNDKAIEEEEKSE